MTYSSCIKDACSEEIALVASLVVVSIGCLVCGGEVLLMVLSLVVLGLLVLLWLLVESNVTEKNKGR